MTVCTEANFKILVGYCVSIAKVLSKRSGQEKLL